MRDTVAGQCNRLQPLDMLRGLAVAGMLLVTSPGAWEHSYSQLRHAEWHGWTLADIVFPTFLFCVGMAFALGFPRQWDVADRKQVWRRVARRTVLLILLGLLLNALPAFDLAELRIPGVLQRIALCYALAATICLLTLRRGADGRAELDWRALAAAAVALLVGYWALLSFVPVPGYGAGRLDSAGNLPAYIDRAIFTVPHLWKWGTTEGLGVTYDPEGLLSTLPATVNVLAGALAAIAIRRRASALALAGAGLALVVAGLLLDPLVPINKRIWTSSFALLSSGFALVLLAAMAGAASVRLLHAASYPLRVLGGNAILAFTLQQVWAAYWGLPLLRDAVGEPLSLQGWMFAAAQRVVADPSLASLLCAVAVVTLITLLVLPFERRGIRLRL